MRKMAKTVRTVPFDYQNELNKFLNKYKIPREDIIDIRHHWNMGYPVFVLTLYADKKLDTTIEAQRNQFNKEYDKVFIVLYCIIGLLFLGTFLWWLWGRI